MSTAEFFAITFFGAALIGIATGFGIRDRRRSLAASVLGTTLWIAVLVVVRFWLSSGN
jgi:hypothetical protein